jgi:DNA (cytosine-5)-methyltransferase 1
MIVKEFEKAGYYIHYKLLMLLNLAYHKKEKEFLLLVSENLMIISISISATNTLNGSKVKLKQVIDPKQTKTINGFSVKEQLTECFVFVKK